MNIYRAWLGFHETPFATLAQHFRRRILASDEEQDGAGMGVGLGATLAILAVPGSFASLFLLEKYSTLLHYFRGQKFDSYQASIADEYFFVVLSMTVTGLVMVLRSNRLLPDRRDFVNLAPMPISIRNVFFANLAVLLGLGALLAVDINAVSAFLFPLLVTISAGGDLAILLRFIASHTVTVLLASAFSFFAVLALQGILMLLPAALLRPVSLFVRILLVVGLLTEFFGNLFLQLFVGRIASHPGTYLEWLPSYWFLGVYEKLTGLASPTMAGLGDRAFISLNVAILVSLAAYAACYHRHFLRVPETMDQMGSARRASRWRLPAWLCKLLFRDGFEHACCNFIVKTLLRNERHLMAFGAYLGVGFVLVANDALYAAAHVVPTGIPPTSVLEIPLLFTFFLLTGLRFTFDIPAGLEANWLFRSACGHSARSANAPRKLMVFASLPLQLFVLFPIMAVSFGWIAALNQTACLLAFTSLLIKALLMNFRKIPFTYRPQRNTKQLVIYILGALVSIAFVLPALASLEAWMMEDPPRIAAVLVMFVCAWYGLRWVSSELVSGPASEEGDLIFEDRAAGAFALLKLVQEE